MKVVRRSMVAVAVAAGSLGLAACGGGNDKSSSSSSSGTPASGGKTGTVTLLQGTAPDYLDPQLGYTTQSAQATWNSYLGLYTYAHKTGAAGSELIPALATAQPKISNGGKTYTMTLRKGLKFSDGKPVKASDFAYSIRRAIKVNWGGKSFFTQYIAGADTFDKGKAKTISGIKTDDATGKITVNLSTAYGAFENVLAFPSAGVVPTGTKMSNLSSSPPPGVGPYKITKVVPNRSYSVVRNPAFTQAIPGVPKGSVDVDVKIVSNNQTSAARVLNNSADIFDWGDTLPPSLLQQISSRAKDRYSKQSNVSTFYFFLNTTTKPFNNLKARQAAVMATDRQALARLASGFQTPGCFFIPKEIIGATKAACPYGDPNAKPDYAKAKQLVQESGMAGTKVTVWGEQRSPRKEFVENFAESLNKIGFKATPKIISDASYFPTIGNLKLNPQAGFADWNQDFPNPSDFYLLLNAKSIQQTNNQNFSQVNDPFIQKELAALNKVPASQLKSVAGRWAKLDEYVAKKAYVSAYGEQSVPQFYSNRIDKAAVAFTPVYGTDFATLKLKG